MTLWTVAHQAPLSMEFSRQEYWSGLPFPSQGDLPHTGIKPVSPAWQVNSLPLSHQGSQVDRKVIQPCCSVTQSCPTLCDPMDCSIPGLPVPHYLPKFAQVHVHCMGDAIQPFHSLIPSSSASIFPSIRDFSNELAVRIK